MTEQAVKARCRAAVERIFADPSAELVPHEIEALRSPAFPVCLAEVLLAKADPEMQRAFQERSVRRESNNVAIWRVGFDFEMPMTLCGLKDPERDVRKIPAQLQECLHRTFAGWRYQDWQFVDWHGGYWEIWNRFAQPNKCVKTWFLHWRVLKVKRGLIL